ncbi:hypothetical protein ANAPC1_00355 [Anaplasma phagocytophilum]|uniref:Uncharacterized protein n=1 Tax=Anaplasma phagocytophilum TaxID=948 RepID=A0A098EHH5_ANAPH|nr:Uncharacterized protein ANAPHAGO_00492 [Anaplasma phagocytophilum]SBO14013.1 hypothetical protein ANAPC1_00355 [Anaplasma phagocytophilum]
MGKTRGHDVLVGHVCANCAEILALKDVFPCIY